MSRVVLDKLCLSILACLLIAASTQSQPAVVVHTYIDDVIRADWAAAESEWLASEVARSRRLGVTYTGVGAKYDCDSPVIGTIDGLRAGAVQYTVMPPQTVADTAVVMVRLQTDRESLDVPYHLVKTGARWRIVSQLWLSTQGWRQRETRYTTVHYQDSSLINDRALDQLDRFIDSLATVFHMPDSLRARMASQKIEYYICDEDAMQRVSGYPVHGMTSTPFDAVVSRHLPHYHELVHAVANVAMQQLPLHQQPCLQEGLAVCLGGRWEKSPAVVMQQGDFMLREQMGKLSDVHTYDGFNQGTGNLDISYALSGLLCGYFIEHAGIDKFIETLRNRSGSDARVRSMDDKVMESVIAGALQVPWDTLAAHVATYAAGFRGSGLHPGAAASPTADSLILNSDALRVKISADKSRLFFEVRSKGKSTHGLILIDPPGGQSFAGYRSRLFAKQAPGVTYNGALFGIEFSAEEAGLYAYDTDVLLAKYLASFDFSPNYWDESNHILRFNLDKSLLPLKIDQNTWHLSQLGP